MNKIIYVGIVCTIIALALMPVAADAQSRNRGSYNSEQWEAWYREWQENNQGGEDIDEDEEEEIVERPTQTRTRGQTSGTQKKIDALDDDEVDDLPIPILFGVTLRDLFPNFGDDRDGGDRTHEGEDILAPLGTPIVSPTDAVVIRTGTGESSGKYVTTANPGGETFVYMHLEDIADIKAGDELEVGDVIGYVGDTGNAKGGPAHLHFEIRNGRKATDPYPRLTEVFSPKEKMKYLENVFKDTSDDDDLAEFLIENFAGEFIAAQAAGIDIPDEIADELPEGLTTVPVTDLSQGMSGNGVVWLQSKLIAENAGPAAKALASAGATGTFGPLTKSALVEYQLDAGISPASGYFGPLTRAYMTTH